jgi:hypothetical protein
MSTPTGDNAFLQELELNVRAELTWPRPVSRKRRPSARRSTSGWSIRPMPSATKSASAAFSARSGHGRPLPTPHHRRGCRRRCPRPARRAASAATRPPGHRRHDLDRQLGRDQPGGLDEDARRRGRRREVPGPGPLDRRKVGRVEVEDRLRDDVLEAREREEHLAVDQYQASVCGLGAALERQGHVLDLDDTARRSDWCELVSHLYPPTGRCIVHRGEAASSPEPAHRRGGASSVGA